MARFQKGQSGNPKGMAKGTRHKMTLALEALLDGEAETITHKAINLAKKGNTMMMRLCLERLLPPRKDRPVNFDLPPLNNSRDAAQAMLVILQATARGELTPSEAAEMSKVIENYAATMQIAELETRLAALEGKAA